MGDIEIYDRRFRDLAIGTSRLEKLFTGTRWAEGPVWFADARCLYFSDIPNDRILRWTEGGEVTAYRSPSRYANGNTRDPQGRLVSCEHGSRSVTRTEYDGTITTIAARFRGKRLNSPNDVVVGSDGVIWFTDPPYGILSDYEGGRAESEQDGNHVYRVDPVTAAVTCVADDFDKPNGLALSPDETCLYVADSGGSHAEGGPHHLRRFRLTGGGLSGGELFAEVDPGAPDGLRTDTEGRVWVSCADGVIAYGPDGTALGKIRVPETVANLTFGGAKRNRLFIAASTSLYSIYVNARGAYRA
ncbi:MAG: gluconolactonase [Treponema sp. GWB1_62_6]|nr:MAG: gluconolactonase [Treponema sp. GWB1_62_6]OHE70130.1 MAG: gluconolactonase [Treponema sp. GWC1_61_84]OHE71232.1 MAG: gluconolactonase [Treponema sp. RIFOXYC1_FULL_61_9]HCM25548.1 gluconolactonase [Treponema sp.]